MDASAILALVQNEPEAVQIAAALVSGRQAVITAPTATECVIVLTSRFGPAGRTIYERVCGEFTILVGQYTKDHVVAALEAFTRFGKGRHAASLNFGDCMCYAAARLSGEPLLAVGNDFPQTDLVFDGGVLGFWPNG